MRLRPFLLCKCCGYCSLLFIISRWTNDIILVCFVILCVFFWRGIYTASRGFPATARLLFGLPCIRKLRSAFHQPPANRLVWKRNNATCRCKQSLLDVSLNKKCTIWSTKTPNGWQKRLAAAFRLDPLRKIRLHHFRQEPCCRRETARSRVNFDM